MNSSKAPGKAAQSLHLVVTGILVLAASACWLVFGLLLHSAATLPHEGRGWCWDTLLAFACLGLLTALTTYMSMYGISKAIADASAWEKRLAWGRRAVGGATVFLVLLTVCVTVFSPGSPWALTRGAWLFPGALFLLWLIRRRRKS